MGKSGRITKKPGRNALAQYGYAKKPRGKQAVAQRDVEQVLRGFQDTDVLKRGLAHFLTSGAGECRKAEPFESLYPILDDRGLRYCCLHDPTHCSDPM
jgi:hypothetical protein